MKKRKKKYITVTPWALKSNSKDKLKAKQMEQVIHWYIHEHIDEIREKALNDFMFGNYNAKEKAKISSYSEGITPLKIVLIDSKHEDFNQC